MAGTTPNLGLYLAGGGSTGSWTPDEVADIDAAVNQNLVDIDTWAGLVGQPTVNRVRNFYGPAADIGTVSPKDGDTYQESDGNKILWKRIGGVWVTGENGMYLIRPTSVVNGTIAADGGTEPSGSALTLSLNGVFSSRFRQFVVDFNFQPVTTSFTSCQLRLRRAGSDIATSTYAMQRNFAAGSGTPAANGSVSTGIEMIPATSSHVNGSAKLSFLAVNAQKSWHGESFYISSGQGGLMNFSGYNYDAGILAPVDGLTFVVAGTNLPTGSLNFVKVYGLA